MSYIKDSFEIVNGAISKDVCRLTSRTLIMAKDITLHSSNLKEDDFPCRDDMVDNSFSRYSPLVLDSLSDTLVKDVVEQVIGEKVIPTYTHCRLYYNGVVMYRHVDRSSSEISASLCLSIDNDHDWPLMMEDKKKQIITVNQKPGDMIVYDGNELPHWREPYEGKLQVNAFFFYIKENGNRTKLKYDTRPMLGLGPEDREYLPDEQFELFPVEDK